jgi:hypothetical protein
MESPTPCDSPIELYDLDHPPSNGETCSSAGCRLGSKRPLATFPLLCPLGNSTTTAGIIGLTKLVTGGETVLDLQQVPCPCRCNAAVGRWWRLWRCRRASILVASLQVACQISRGYFYSRLVRDSLLRIPDPAGDDEGCRPPAPGSWPAHHFVDKWWLDGRPARPMAAKSRVSG